MTVVAPSGRADAGDGINYTLTATNDGNVTLTGVTIADPKLGALVCTPPQPATLAPGEQMVCTGSYTLTQADLDSGAGRQHGHGRQRADAADATRRARCRCRRRRRWRWPSRARSTDGRGPGQPRRRRATRSTTR